MARIKGTSLIKMLKVLQKNPTAAERLIPGPLLQTYLEERVLSSSWYPEEDYKVLLLALGAILEPMVKGDVWEFIGMEGAQQDFTGVYASAVRKGDPVGALQRLGKVWSMFRDTGRVEVVPESPTVARVLLHDYALVCPQICGTVTGYLRRFLELCGAADISCQLVRAPNPKQGPCEWRVGYRAV